MWERIKGYARLAAGAVAGIAIAVLAFLLKRTKGKLGKAEGRIADLNGEIGKKDAELSASEAARDGCRAIAEKVADAKDEEAESISRIDGSADSYNAMIGGFNEETGDSAGD